MIRGQRAAGVAVRDHDGHVHATALRIPAVGRRLRAIPLIRGLIAVGETVSVGATASAWAQDPRPRGATEVHARASASTAPFVWFALVLWLFAPGLVAFALPLGAAPQAVLEGALRLGLLAGYLVLGARAAGMRRAYQYHAAEHMTLRALELGIERTVPAVRRLEWAHARCGTGFLLALAVVAALVFPVLGAGPWWWQLGSRVLLAPLAVGLATEAVRLQQRLPPSRPRDWLEASGLALQRLTTRQPDDEQLQVAIAALEACLRAERKAELDPLEDARPLRGA